MKQIKIQHFTEPNEDSNYINRNKYKVTLGNDYTQYFDNRKKVSAYLNSTNKYLNEILQELNLYYNDVFCLFRNAWVYFDNQKLEAKERKIYRELTSLNSNFDLIIKRSSTLNGNYLTWGFLNKIINGLLSILEELEPFFQYKGHTDKKIKIASLIRVLKGLKSNLLCYPETEENLKEKLKKLL